jgi:hypothetical protein
MAVTPAGAEVSNAVATNWKKIWNKELKPQADQRYYTKKKSNKRYYTKSDSDAKYQAAGSGYTKAESDTRYQPKGNYALTGSSYTKAESDGKYVPVPTTYRGSFLAHGYVPAAGEYATTDIVFPVQLKVAPLVHVIDTGAAVPPGCTGTAGAPGASPGNLCIFVAGKTNVNANAFYTCKGAGTSCALGAVGSADPWGLTMYAVATAAGRTQAYGSWALNPGGAAGVSTTRSGDDSLTTPGKGSPAGSE